MRCSQATQQLQLYIDHQLSWEKIHPLEVHIAVCAECRRELVVLEEIASALESTQPVIEPADLTANIMQRVALDVQQREHEKVAREVYVPLRPSLREILAVIVLATMTTLGIILGQPALRASLPFANGHDQFSQAVITASHFFASVNSGTLTLAFWVLGTLLGVGITLMLAGNEIRDEWFKAISHKLPVW
ncbi:MAG: hypothetical protein NVS4B11_35110 [Ktedonobacteraceae bacterium]